MWKMSRNHGRYFCLVPVSSLLLKLRMATRTTVFRLARQPQERSRSCPVDSIVTAGVMTVLDCSHLFPMEEMRVGKTAASTVTVNTL
jgi:hypothetical protein